MKKTFFSLILVASMTLLLTSCYTYTFSVGDGAQTGVEVKETNHYLIYGLAPIGVSNPYEMAGDTENYDVTIKHSFVNGLLNAITFGIYTPTTTIVTK